MYTRSITFWEENVDRLLSEAGKRNVSVNWMVNQLVKEGLERLKPAIEVTS